MNQGVEPEVRKFLLKILYSICYGIMWLALNVLGGIYWEYGIIHNGISLANVLFFSWFILSTGLLLRYYYRTWKE